jgi:rare lipoprotein A
MKYGILIVLVALGVSGCAHKKRARTAPPPAPAPAVKPGDVENGVASWYGHPYHGRAAASGEIYDMEQLTAAHRTLPFNTWVRVVNLNNSKAVEVRINDRGPFIDGRIIDLSHAAALAVDLVGPGTAPVRLEILRMPEVAAAGTYAVQVGSFRDRQNAERIRASMQARYGSARIILRQGNPATWRVVVGSETTESGASALSDRIRQESGERNAFVVRLDS